MLVRGFLGTLGALLVLVGVVFFGQGINVLHGSSMSGHHGYAALGAVLLVLGVALLAQVWRLRAGRSR